MTKLSAIIGMVLGVSLIWGSAAVGRNAAAMSAADRKFVLSAARGGMADGEP